MSLSAKRARIEKGSCPLAVGDVWNGSIVIRILEEPDGSFFVDTDDMSALCEVNSWASGIVTGAVVPEGTDEANPKDIIGATKVPLHLWPSTATILGAMAFLDGALKYGPYNWRGKKVRATVYVSAVTRHMLSWLDGEEDSDDAGIHHVGHALACLAIIADAQVNGCLIDDRPAKGSASSLLRRFQDKVKALLERYERKGAL